MAIAIRRPAFYKISAVKEFTDRTEPRRAFWNRYAKMVAEGSTVITFYGTGGVGKSALLKKLEEEIKRHDELTGNECKYVKYDLNISTDPREVLKTFKFQLSAYGCEFPLFEVGNYYYSLKIGQDVTPLKAKSMLEKIPGIGKFKKNLSKLDAELTKVNPVLKTAKLFFEVTDEVLQAIPVTKAITTCFSIADKFLIDYMELTKVLDDDHMAIRNQLNACRQEKNPMMLYEFLPTLFAQDVTDWMVATGNKLVVILDNYESLTGATSLATSEQSKRDSWLRELIFMMPDTLWTIAGRNKLHWTSELADEMEQHFITVLSPEDSSWFLERADITDENLRGELVKLTEGYPIFLDLCVDVYTEYKRQNNAEPTIDEFGSKREEVVGRILRYFDAAGDDTGKDMLNFLCVLNMWTKEIAVDIGKAALPNFSYSTYDRVKNFSFIQAERIENENFNFMVLNFDRTIQNILVATIDEKLISDVTTAVDNHFKKAFEDKKAFDAKEIFYLTLWAEFVVRFADDAEKLLARYKDTLDDYVSVLTDGANFDAAEEILKLFMSKLEALDATDTAPYANFEKQLSWFRRVQGNYNEAYELAKTAHKKCVRLLGNEHLDTIMAMNNLAISLRAIGRYNEAIKLADCAYKKLVPILSEEHLDTISAMTVLAISMSNLGRYDEAIEWQKKILTVQKKISGDEHLDTIMAMNNLAMTLRFSGRYSEALTLQEKVLSLRKKILGDEDPDTLMAMNNLALTLNKLGRYDEALKLQEKVLTLREKILGNKHPDTLGAMNNLALTLNNLGRCDEALKMLEQVLTLRKEKLGDEHPDTVRSMQGLANSLSKLDRYDEALKLMETAVSLFKKTLGDGHSLTITAMKDLAKILHDGGELDKAVHLIERAATLAKEKLGDEHPETKEILDLRGTFKKCTNS